jgi:hypothetical protein
MSGATRGPALGRWAVDVLSMPEGGPVREFDAQRLPGWLACSETFEREDHLARPSGLAGGRNEQ